LISPEKKGFPHVFFALRQNDTAEAKAVMGQGGNVAPNA